MRLLICAGGTGGGVYPALAVLRQLGNRTALETLWVGGLVGMEADLVKREGISFAGIPAAGVHGVGWRALPGNLLRLGQGLLAARRLLRQFQPEVLFFTGGYVAVPVALAARWHAAGSRRPKSLLYVPDIEPGLALKTLARFADQIALTAAESKPYFRHDSSMTVTGYPVRKNLQAWQSQASRKFFQLEENMPILLVLGGSKGARSVNQAVLGALVELLGEMQIIHVSGQLDWPEVKAASDSLEPTLARRYHAFPYLHEEMGAALSSADLVVSRAGASTLGEYPLFGLPAILVPYPFAWRYQIVNAQYLSERGAALVIEDAELRTQLLPQVRALMQDEPRRAKMKTAMQALAQPEAAESIAGLLVAMAGHSSAAM